MTLLSHLPPEVLHIVFNYLDSRSILAVAESCKRFNEIISGSETLTRKLTLYLRYPQDLEGFSESVLSSTRRYRKMCIKKSRDSTYPQASYRHMFAHVGRTIRELKIDWSNSIRPREANLYDIMNRRRAARGGFLSHFMSRQDAIAGAHVFVDHAADDDDDVAQGLALARIDVYNEFVSILRHFTYIEILKLYFVHLERERPANEPVVQYPHLRNVFMKQCDSFCFNLLSSCLLSKLVIIEPWWNNRVPGIEAFESFLTNQIILKDLRLINVQYPRLFTTDKSALIKFKLETLVLINVFFAHKGFALNFFQTQMNLRFVEMQLRNEKTRMLDEVLFYNNILRFIVKNCRHLETLNIAKIRYRLTDTSFIADSSNNNVKSLIFKVTEEDNSSELFKVFVRIFPNLQSIDFKACEGEDTDSGVCFDEGTVLDYTDKLIVTNSSVRSLVNVVAPVLKEFEYAPGKTGEFIDDQLGGFFHRHRHIKHLTIGSRTGRSYFFVSYNLCELIFNFLTQLESITIYGFGEVNKSVKLLCKLQKLKTLTISADDYQQFTAKTKVECSRNEVVLNSVDINIPIAPAILEI